MRACRDNAWTLCTWARGESWGKVHRQPARCRSWRHEGDCARWRASVDWRRMKDAFEPYPAQDCVLLVLTLARAESPDPPTDEELERWGSPDQAWPELGNMLAKFLKRLNRMQCRECGCYGPVTYWTKPRVWRGKMRPARKVTRKRCRGQCSPHDSRWVSIVEQHRPKFPDFRAWPHLNVLIAWPWLAAKVRSWGNRGTVERKGKVVEDGKIPTGEILEHCVGADFGYQSWAMVAQDREALAGYFAKIAGEAVGEVSKLTQLPLAAPRGFRRLRSGQGFLPRRFASKRGGCLVGRARCHVCGAKDQCECARFEGERYQRAHQAMSRAERGVQTRVENGPPTYRPERPTRWIDWAAKEVYHPDWPGWQLLEPAEAQCEARGSPTQGGAVIHLDLRDSRAPPRTKHRPRLAPRVSLLPDEPPREK